MLRLIVTAQWGISDVDVGIRKKGNAPSGLLMISPIQHREFIIDKMGKALPDAITEAVVNDRIRAIIEELEPGVHNSPR